MWSHQGGFNLHICRPPIRNKHPLPPSMTTSPPALYWSTLHSRPGDVVPTGWFQPTHMPLPSTATSTPHPLKQPQEATIMANQGDSTNPGSNWKASLNRLKRCFTNQSGGLWSIYPPLPYGIEATSEHGAFEVGKPTQGCATHREKKPWGNHIYGDTVSTVEWTQTIEERNQVVDAQWCWNNIVFTVILILYRRTHALYTTSKNVCQD